MTHEPPHLKGTKLMTHPTGAAGRRRRTLAVALAGATTALLALAANAGANVYSPNVVTGSGPGTLQDAVAQANTNACTTLCTAAPGTNVIKLGLLQYKPSSTITISAPVIITGNPQAQPPGQLPTVDGSAVTIPAGATGDDLFVVAANVNRVVFKALTLTNGGTDPGGFVAIRVKGTTEIDNVAMSGNTGTYQLGVDTGGTAVVNNTSINDGTATGINNNGTLTLNNVTVANNFNGGLFSGGSLRLANTIVANNNPLANFGVQDCTITGAKTTTASLDSDGTCGVARSGVNPNLGPSSNNGGPSPSLAPAAGSQAINNGDNTVPSCTNDQRFFVRSDGLCDIGSYEVGAARDTTPPTCTVTATRIQTAGAQTAGDQQDVTVTDSGAGLGFDAISNVTTTNGSVAFTAPTNPTRSGLVLTATRSAAGSLTHWSFTATDWAGNSTNCR
jgi:hypothetical protein